MKQTSSPDISLLVMGYEGRFNDNDFSIAYGLVKKGQHTPLSSSKLKYPKPRVTSDESSLYGHFDLVIHRTLIYSMLDSSLSKSKIRQ